MRLISRGGRCDLSPVVAIIATQEDRPAVMVGGGGGVPFPESPDSVGGAEVAASASAAAVDSVHSLR